MAVCYRKTCNKNGYKVSGIALKKTETIFEIRVKTTLEHQNLILIFDLSTECGIYSSSYSFFEI